MDILWAIIAWAIFGLIVGAIARAIYPGRQEMGLAMTIALGIFGSLVGGFLSWAFGFSPDHGAFQGAGWIMSIVGAIIVVWAGLAFSGGQRPARRPM